jgi:branched-chain amino acid transport system permease protein
MDFSIASILALDGLTNGAIYALLALATVLVFAVTRVIFIPQGEFVAFGALTLACCSRAGAGHGVVPAGAGGGGGRCNRGGGTAAPRPAAARGAPCAAHAGLAGGGLAAGDLGRAAEACRCWCRRLLTVALVTPFGPLIYRLAYESLADASVLVLLIVSVGVHFALTGLGLYFFGAEGFPQPSFWDERFSSGR